MRALPAKRLTARPGARWRHRFSGYRIRIVEWLDVVVRVGQVDDGGRQIRPRRPLLRVGIQNGVVEPADFVPRIHVERTPQFLELPHSVYLDEPVFIVIVSPT